MNRYAELEDRKTAADEQMVASARLAIDQVEKLSADQKTKLQNELAMNDNREAILDRMAKAEDANRLNSYILEARAKRRTISSGEKLNTSTGFTIR